MCIFIRKKTVKGVDYGITVGLTLKNTGIAWFDLVLVIGLRILAFNDSISLVDLWR